MSSTTRRPGLGKPGEKRVAQATAIPAVPVRTPIFETDDPESAPKLSRTWILFFESLGKAFTLPPWRTLLIYDTAVANDIAPRLTAQASGIAERVVGILRAALVADLAIRINLNGAALITCTIPAATAPGAVLTFEAFASHAIADGDKFTWDVTAGSGATDDHGVAAFTLQWRLA